MLKRIAATAAGLVIIAVSVAGQASAATGWVCSDLAQSPTEAGVVGMFYDAVARGYRGESGAKLIVNTVLEQCPEYLGLVVNTANKFG